MDFQGVLSFEALVTGRMGASKRLGVAVADQVPVFFRLVAEDFSTVWEGTLHRIDVRRSEFFSGESRKRSVFEVEILRKIFHCGGKEL